MNMTRAMIYVRISKDREGAGLGVDRQREDCVALATRLGWTVVGTHTDNDLSAYSGKPRPGYRSMLAALDDGNADAVIAWHTDRLHRSPTELESFIDLCERRSVTVQTVQAGVIDLSNASGRMIARMLGAAARHEVEHSIERQKRAKQQAAMDGRYRGGRRPFGYESDGVTLRPVEADELRTATDRVLAGVSLAQVGREWNERAIRTTMGNSWSSREVRNLLLRARNAALVSHNGTVLGQARWPAAVEPETFYAVRAMLNDPVRRVGASRERKWLGAGLYRCGVCGAPMRSWTAYGQGKRPNRNAYRCTLVGHLSRIAQPVDDLVEAVTLERLSRPDAALVLGAPGVDLGRLQTRRDGLQARLDELAGMFADGALDGSQLREGTTRLRASLLALDTELEHARSSSDLARLVLAGDDLASRWKATPVDVRGRVVDALMVVTIEKSARGRQPDGSYFNPEHVQIEWKVGQ